MRTEDPARSNDVAAAALRKPVVLRVIRREVGKALSTFVAISCAGVAGLGFWAAVLAALGLRPERAWPLLAVLTGLVLVVGAVAGARHLTGRIACSDPLCDGSPAPDDVACPGCHRTIVEPHRREEPARRGTGTGG